MINTMDETNDILVAFDVEAVLKQLTTTEKISLLSGTDFWHTAPIERLNVPAIRMSDGPNGVRGTKFFNGVPANCFPCGTALGATWNTDLVRKGGVLQAKEAIAKGASAILGPTVNIQRSPVGGRGFESFSEDPFLTGCISAAAIKGIQSEGVAATLKHFVCNDQEDHRQSADCVVSERALREIYLSPFHYALEHAQPMALMTAYNQVNGTHCSDNLHLLRDILREEWAYSGLVMSDWYGTYSTVESVKAGTDLEMPGPSVWRSQLLQKAISYGKLSIHELDTCVRRVLSFVRQAALLGIPEHATETALEDPAIPAILRQLATESIVLLKNDKALLPLNPNKTTAVIGPNAAIATYCGGGSASLDATYTVTPLEGLSAQSDKITYALGCSGLKNLPLLSEMTKNQDGKQGLDMHLYLEPPTAEHRVPFAHIHIKKSDALLMDYKHPSMASNLFYADITGTLTPHVSGQYDFGVSVAGTAKLYIDDECIIDNETTQTPGQSFLNTGTVEVEGSTTLQADHTYTVHMTFGSDPTTKLKREGTTGLGPGGFRIGAARRLNATEELAAACETARHAEQVVLCVGLNSDWESEGYDRPHMKLPPGTDTLIDTISAVNPNTVVVLQSGTPVSMPWIDRIPAVMQAWYGGNECGNAIADIIFGAANPSGKLPLSFPLQVQDNPAFLHSTSNRNQIRYGEDVFVGYRYYEAVERQTLFPFGHGLSYTRFEFDNASLKVGCGKEEVVVSVNVKNVGDVDGAQVVQVYVQQKNPSVQRPVKELRGFEKIMIQAGKTRAVQITMSKRNATSFWDEQRHAWISEQDDYDVFVGDSSASASLRACFRVQETTFWKGCKVVKNC